MENPFRNVSGPLPGFVETFVDNGYTDMKQVMRTLVAVDFRGMLKSPWGQIWR